MIHKEFFGLLFLGFVAWIFLATDPKSRIEHFCSPVGWVGNVLVSVTALIAPTQQELIQTWFYKFDYGCQYLVWRVIYQEAYNKQQAAAAASSAPSSASQPKVVIPVAPSAPASASSK